MAANPPLTPVAPTATAAAKVCNTCGAILNTKAYAQRCPNAEAEWHAAYVELIKRLDLSGDVLEKARGSMNQQVTQLSAQIEGIADTRKAIQESAGKLAAMLG